MWERDWRQAGVTTIALTGAKSSGKSIYIAVLVQALEAYLLHSLHTSLKAVADADQGLSRLGTADRYTNYYQQRLFVERRKPDATPVGTDKWNWRVPLVFSLGQIHGMPRYLCIRDLPGEYIEQAMSATEWDFLGRADGVLFLFDSERTSDVQNKLGRHGDFTVTLAANLGLPPLDVLDSVLHMIGPSAPPLGLILAKLDYIWALRDVEMLGSLPAAISNLGASYIREPEQRENLTDQSHWAYPWADENGTYHPADPSDRDFLNEELRSLLTALGGGELLARLSGRKPSLEHRLFAVSALGEPIRGKSVSMRGITPYRVLDPVLWLLDRSWREA
ncbi:MAG: hypothetical protein LBK42_10130 [Propionibacteriaceae bacterium]|jgi:hypothetical protein|nr:hypothetical protein [Propionibacteriaceae bacterium]